LAAGIILALLANEYGRLDSVTYTGVLRLFFLFTRWVVTPAAATQQPISKSEYATILVLFFIFYFLVLVNYIVIY